MGNEMQNLETIRTLAELDNKRNNEEWGIAFLESCYLIEMLADFYAQSGEMTFFMFLETLNINILLLSEKEIYIANEMHETCKEIIAKKSN